MFRVIASLQISDGEAVKTTKFDSPIYLGDPLNIIKILNAKGAQEIFVADINATRKKEPDWNLIRYLASESCVPFSYGGGINSSTDVKNLMQMGIERVYINSFLFENYKLVRRISEELGSSSVGISLDMRKINGEWKIFSNGGTQNTGANIGESIRMARESKAGEIVIKLIDYDGVYKTRAIEDFTEISKLVREESNSEDFHLIASCGIHTSNDLVELEKLGFDGTCLSSQIFFSNPETKKSILISYPSEYSII